jgi:hypothetical protein
VLRHSARREDAPRWSGCCCCIPAPGQVIDSIGKETAIGGLFFVRQIGFVYFFFLLAKIAIAQKTKKNKNPIFIEY